MGRCCQRAALGEPAGSQLVATVKQSGTDASYVCGSRPDLRGHGGEAPGGGRRDCRRHVVPGRSGAGGPRQPVLLSWARLARGSRARDGAAGVGAHFRSVSGKRGTTWTGCHELGSPPSRSCQPSSWIPRAGSALDRSSMRVTPPDRWSSVRFSNSAPPTWTAGSAFRQRQGGEQRSRFFIRHDH